MKAFLITLVIIAALFLVFDLRWQNPAESMVFTLHARERIAAYVPALKNVVQRSTASPATRIIEASPSSLPTKIDDGFKAPQIETLESLTRNWTLLPQSAFPRQIKLTGDAKVALQERGASVLHAGASVTALTMESGQVVIAPTETSSARGKVSIERTDLKTQITASYWRWVEQQNEISRARWLAHQQKSAPPSIGTSADGKPTRAADGSYPLLLASMKSGQVSLITPKKVKQWGASFERVINDKATWCIDVIFGTEVFCGPIDAKAQARVRGGRVIEWVFPDSGEPVP